MHGSSPKDWDLFQGTQLLARFYTKLHSVKRDIYLTSRAPKPSPLTESPALTERAGNDVTRITVRLQIVDLSFKGMICTRGLAIRLVIPDNRCRDAEARPKEAKAT